MFEIEKDRTWTEIDLSAMAHNMRVIRENTNKAAEIMAVIKANAYGHGMEQAYRILRENGADCFAVATLQEAIDLRGCGATEPILILGYVQPEAISSLLNFDIMPTVFDAAVAERFGIAAAQAGKKLRVHIKVDSGMSRLGFSALEGFAEETVQAIRKISEMGSVEIDGVFSHLSCADTDRAYTKLQFQRFMAVCDTLQAQNVQIGKRHICNSAGIVLEPEMHLDMVRPGIILYGLHPDKTTYGKINLKPAMRWYARITNIKTVKAGTPVSYGNTYIAEQDMRIGTVCVGYADGYSRSLSGKVKMIAGGVPVKQIGRICMDQCMIDLTDVHTIDVGDPVLLMGAEACVTADAMAEMLGTINYEIVCDVGARVPRVYMPME